MYTLNKSGQMVEGKKLGNKLVACTDMSPMKKSRLENTFEKNPEGAECFAEKEEQKIMGVFNAYDREK